MTPIIGILLAANVLAYAALVLTQGGVDISASTIERWGGLAPLEVMDGALWRFVAAGFLHFSPIHIISNSICLLAWGIPIDRYLGPLRLLTIYIASIMAGSIASVALHTNNFISAGASGGTSGLLGAIMVLGLLRQMQLTASFVLSNIGLNIAIAAFTVGIDWQAHLGGFLGGMLITALIAPRTDRNTTR